MVKLTLLVCTYNNARILDGTLQSFVRQSYSQNDWEVLVVMNNCTDRTLSVCQQFQAGDRIPQLRILSESRQGLAFARKTGLMESRGEWVAFIDDDCRLSPDWVVRAIEFTDSHPDAGVVGGRNILDWEVEPSQLHAAYGESYAAQDWGEKTRPALVHNREIPCGAGMLIRRTALIQSGYLENSRLVGRDPIQMGAGEDTETALFIARDGWEVWYCAELELHHFIPSHRMSLRYMFRIHHGFGRAEAYLRCLSAREEHRFSGRLRPLLAALKEFALLCLSYRCGIFVIRRQRPAWWIRWHYAIGFIRGAVVNLIYGGSPGPKESGTLLAVSEPETDSTTSGLSQAGSMSVDHQSASSDIQRVA